MNIKRCELTGKSFLLEILSDTEGLSLQKIFTDVADFRKWLPANSKFFEGKFSVRLSGETHSISREFDTEGSPHVLLPLLKMLAVAREDVANDEVLVEVFSDTFQPTIIECEAFDSVNTAKTYCEQALTRGLPCLTIRIRYSCKPLKVFQALFYAESDPSFSKNSLDELFSRLTSTDRHD